MSSIKSETRTDTGNVGALSTPTPSILLERAFKDFSPAEVVGLVQNLFAILPQSGCVQVCKGCHAAASPSISTATWGTTVGAVLALEQAAQQHSITVQGGVDPKFRLIEVFRDADPAHLIMNDNRGAQRGLGDFAQLIREHLQQQIKIMTSGLWFAESKREIERPLSDSAQFCEEQLKSAAQFAGRMSVSITTQTQQYKRLGAEQDAKILARTYEACLVHTDPNVPVYLDMFTHTQWGDDPMTLEIKILMYKVIDEIDPKLLSPEEKASMKKHVENADHSVDGSERHAWILEGRNIGIRIAPYIRDGRAEKGQETPGFDLSEVKIGDLLSVLPGKADDQIGFSTKDGSERITFTRTELEDPNNVSNLVQAIQKYSKDAFLCDNVNLEGNWLSFFRAELDLSAFASTAHLHEGKDTNPPSGVNLLLSDFAAGHFQVSVPFKRMYL